MVVTFHAANFIVSFCVHCRPRNWMANQVRFHCKLVFSVPFYMWGEHRFSLKRMLCHPCRKRIPHLYPGLWQTTVTREPTVTRVLPECRCVDQDFQKHHQPVPVTTSPIATGLGLVVKYLLVTCTGVDYSDKGVCAPNPTPSSDTSNLLPGAVAVTRQQRVRLSEYPSHSAQSYRAPPVLLISADHWLT